MQKHQKTAKLDLHCCERSPRLFVWLGSSLLCLCAASILSMPVTQRLWSWDRFLHGGQDFEFGILMALTLLCLALVVSKQCKRNVNDSFFHICRTFFNYGSDLLPVSPAIETFATFIEPTVSPSSGVYSIPLQI